MGLAFVWIYGSFLNWLIDDKDSRSLGIPAKDRGIFDMDSSEMLKTYDPIII